MSDKAKKDWKKVIEDHALLDDEALEKTDEAAVALEHPSYEGLEEKLTLAEQQVHDHWEKLTRAMAEMDNMRRRTEREVANAHRYGTEKLLTALLPVVDSLEQAEQLAQTHGDRSMHEGMALTMKLLLDVLEKAGVTQLNPVGEVFNPQLHEAMSMQESADVAPNTVLVVFQKGYSLSDRVIRPARVIVSKTKTPS
ncbi:MAG: nucleotide exchange factor GrpE [Legionellaceae bacterium]